MKKVFSILATGLFALSLTLTSCGGEQKPAVDAAQAAADSAAAAAAAADSAAAAAAAAAAAVVDTTKVDTTKQ